MNNFIVIGPTTLDIQVFLQDLTEKNSLTSSYTIGGKGFNIAYTLKLFEITVGLCSMYGDDEAGTYIQKQLQKFHIDTYPSNVVHHPSSLFVGVHNQRGETVFEKCDTSLYDLQILPQLEWSDSSVVIVLSSTNAQVLNELKNIKRSHPHITFCLEMSGSKTVEHINPYISVFNFLIANRKEATALSFHRGYQTNFRDIISSFIADGLERVIITLDKDGIMFGERIENSVVIDSLPIIESKEEIVSTIGAGDSVTAAVCASLYKYKKPLRESARIASEIASLTIRSHKPYLDSLPHSLKGKL